MDQNQVDPTQTEQPQEEPPMEEQPQEVQPEEMQPQEMPSQQEPPAGQPPAGQGVTYQVQEYARKPWATGVAGLVVGLFVGLVVLGWWLWPVRWTDAAPSDLVHGYQDWWLQMSIISYGATQDAATAKAEYDSLGNFAPTTLARVQANPGHIDPKLISQYSAAVGAPSELPTVATSPGSSTSAPGGTTTAPGASTTSPSGTTTAKPATTATTTGGGTTSKGRSSLGTLLLVMCVVTLLVGAAIVAYIVLQGRRKAAPVSPAAEMAPGGEVPPTEWTNYPAATEQAPMVQFMASYKAGDDLFDDSFSIDSPSGEFLGECGVGISEVMGVGVPKKVTAFEVWLFDKNDIQTVTKVLMSDHAFNDPTIRQKLEAKGEPFQAVAGGQTILETATLKLVARVVDMAFGQGAMPENSFFDSLVLELAIWQKQ